MTHLTPEPCRVLILENSAQVADIIVRELAKASGPATKLEHARASTRTELVSMLREGAWDLMFSGEPPRIAVADALALVHAHQPGLPFVVVACEVSPHHAAWCLENGAADFFPLAETWRIGPVIRRELAAAKARRRLAQIDSPRAAPASPPDELVGRVSHDFNNILSMIGLSIELAEGLVDKSESALGQAIHRIRTVQERALHFTNQIAERHRLEARAPAQIPLDPTVRELAEIFAPLVGEKTRLELRLAAPDAVAGIGRCHLERVLTNLITNARDAVAAGGGAIVVSTSVASGVNSSSRRLRHGSYLCLSVTDTGPGIAPEILARIFEPRFTTKSGGSGLGLAIAKELVVEHGGEIDVRSQPGHGTTFTVWIPRANAEAKLQAVSSNQ